MLTIRYVTPFDINKNIADAYNHEMSLGGADYICFMDRDTIILDPHYGTKIHDIVAANPGNYFTCYTNRTNCVWQRWDADSGNDIAQHTNTARHLWNRFQDDVEDHTRSQLWSGHMMICPVEKWRPIEKRGLLGIDNIIHENAREQGAKVLLMKSIYIYHWYSNHDGKNGNKQRDKSHLQ